MNVQRNPHRVAIQGGALFGQSKQWAAIEALAMAKASRAKAYRFASLVVALATLAYVVAYVAL